MPLYEFQCIKCQHQTEVFQKIHAPNTRTCPNCGSNTFTKKVSAPQFKLKGTGWYETDFKTPKNTSQKKTSETSAPKDTSPQEKSNSTTEKKESSRKED